MSRAVAWAIARARVTVTLLVLLVAASARLAVAQTPPTPAATATTTAPAATPNAPAATPTTATAPAAAAPASPAPPATAGSAGPPKSFTDAVPCSACHNTTAWRAKGAAGGDARFDHSTTGFPLTGQHINTSCVACHNTARSLKRACVSCHEDFHRGRLARSCDTCHSPAGWKVTRPLEIHRMTRFPLTGVHVLADCSECHQRASEHRWTGAPIDCFACHEKDYRRDGLRPAHVGSGTLAPFPRDCSLCHKSLAWAPATFAGPAAGSVGSALRVAPQGHDLRFPIAFGVHRTATCDDCHASQAAPRAVRCIGCHAHDPVRLMQQHRDPVATDGASCLGCHPGGARR
jgi:hypothetical protein